MSPSEAVFTWTGQRALAAQLVAEDRKSDEAIAAEIGVGRATLTRWKQAPAFRDRVLELRVDLQEQLLAEGIADRRQRVLALNARWRKMQQVLDARALEHAEVPGGSSGLLVRETKLVKVFAAAEAEVEEELEGQPHGGALRRRRNAGPLQSTGMSQEVVEYAVDTALLRELRAHEEQAARELGQWEDKRTVKVEVDKELDRALDALGKTLKPEEYARVLEALAAGDTRPAAA